MLRSPVETSSTKPSVIKPLLFSSEDWQSGLSEKIDSCGIFDKNSVMPAKVDLQQMTIPDKLRLMEALWQDLSRSDADVDSPAWHDDVLAERDRLVESGEETFLDWEAAKRKLREELQ